MALLTECAWKALDKEFVYWTYASKVQIGWGGPHEPAPVRSGKVGPSFCPARAAHYRPLRGLPARRTLTPSGRPQIFCFSAWGCRERGRIAGFPATAACACLDVLQARGTD